MLASPGQVGASGLRCCEARPVTSSTPVVLGIAGRRAGYRLLTAGALMIVVGVWFRAYSLLPGALFFTVPTAWLLLVRSGDVVRLQDDALVVFTAGRERRYPWSDVLEISWARPVVGPGPMLRVRGGPYDQPGPNIPAQVARLPIFGRGAQRAANAALGAAAQQQGIRFSDTMERNIATDKRRPRLPGEDDPQR